MSIIRPTENDEEIKNYLDSLIINDFIKPFGSLTDKVKEFGKYSREYGDEFDSRIDEMFKSLRKDELNLIKLEMRLKRIFELIGNKHGDCEKAKKTQEEEMNESYCKFANQDGAGKGNSSSNKDGELRSVSSCVTSMEEVTVDPIIKSAIRLCSKKAENEGESECESEISARITTDGEVRNLLESYIRGEARKGGAGKEEASKGGAGKGEASKGGAGKGEASKGGAGKGEASKGGAGKGEAKEGKKRERKSALKKGINGEARLRESIGRREGSGSERVTGGRNGQVSEKRVVENGMGNGEISGGKMGTLQVTSNNLCKKELVSRDTNAKRRIKMDSVKRTLRLPKRNNKCEGLCHFLDKWCCCYSFFFERNKSGGYFKMSTEEWSEFLSSIEIKGGGKPPCETQVETGYDIEGLPPLVVEYESLNVKNNYAGYASVNNQMYNAENLNTCGYGLNNSYAYNNGYSVCNNGFIGQGYGPGYSYNSTPGCFYANCNQVGPVGACQQGLQGTAKMMVPVSNPPSSYKGFRGRFKGKGKKMQEEIKQVQKVRTALESKANY
ncbi:hypothetical protein FG386_002195 [Cryptosporidium ryanae]|uniref:uncharacterized protein n=1 Tax=Cryptosporidium ryanae TaxID=515981 RepID=UPI00351A795C|nr:hypothetical protein FG386_002195 [Cryptosporidium ryanae]